MINKKNFWLAICLTAITAISTFFITYTIFNKRIIDQNPINDIETKTYTLNDDVEKQEQQTETAEVAAVNIARITPSTKLVYEYYYEGDGQTKREEEVPPYFLLDMTREDIEEKYPDWQLKSFSNSEVVMRKNIAGKIKERYIIGEYDGYVAVFFEQPVDGVSLRELTDTPISSLTEEEQTKLKIGISILGEEALINAMENYES